jgi:hypothetical protein
MLAISTQGGGDRLSPLNIIIASLKNIKSSYDRTRTDDKPIHPIACEQLIFY